MPCAKRSIRDRKAHDTPFSSAELAGHARKLRRSEVPRLESENACEVGCDYSLAFFTYDKCALVSRSVFQILVRE